MLGLLPWTMEVTIGETGGLMKHTAKKGAIT